MSTMVLYETVETIYTTMSPANKYSYFISKLLYNQLFTLKFVIEFNRKP